jgi:UDP-N-acetylglucosamine--N-acetylmuramyl-(pentapeptide) pyrophosphoryl-undecaprenol N-acetylglucosamine transferase
MKNMSPHSPHILISGGGTGGHIFPAIAIANALKERLEHAEFMFIGAKGRMEMEKVPLAGYPIKGIWISGFQRKLTLRNLMFPVKLVSSLCTVSRIISGFRPDLAIGTGGYASGPALKVSTQRGIPALILEQNSFPGITNKLLARQVDLICVAHQGMERFFPPEKIIFTGNPVRKDILDISDKKAQALSFFGLDDSRKIVVVIGGSQGALSINNALAQLLPRLLESDLQIIWQTGKGFYGQAMQRVSELMAGSVSVHSFIERMDLAYAAADAVLSRAGAIAISELCLVRKPAILVPLPHAAEDHQTKNALSLVDQQAALMIRDDQLMEQLVPKVVGLTGDKKAMNDLSQNIAKLGRPDAADRIASEAIRLMNKPVKK